MSTPPDASYKVAQRNYAQRARMGRYLYMNIGENLEQPARRAEPKPPSRRDRHRQENRK